MDARTWSVGELARMTGLTVRTRWTELMAFVARAREARG
jgi:hypothetical protein